MHRRKRCRDHAGMPPSPSCLRHICIFLFSCSHRWYTHDKIHEGGDFQGRWLHYKAVKPSWLARLGCRLFDPLSSMASASGLQAAIYLVGKIRVALGLVVGLLSRLIGIRGMFYRVVGAQATAIDDLTGTLPPFDRFLVYGPVHCDQVVQAIQKETNMRCAIVDVNDKSAATGGAVLTGSKAWGMSRKVANASEMKTTHRRECLRLVPRTTEAALQV